MKFNILISETARKQLYDLDVKTRENIKNSIKELEENPFSSRPKADIKKLKGSKNPELYRLRIGNHRVIYCIIEKEVKVTKI